MRSTTEEEKIFKDVPEHLQQNISFSLGCMKMLAMNALQFACDTPTKIATPNKETVIPSQKRRTNGIFYRDHAENIKLQQTRKANRHQETKSGVSSGLPQCLQQRTKTADLTHERPSGQSLLNPEDPSWQILISFFCPPTQEGSSTSSQHYHNHLSPRHTSLTTIRASEGVCAKSLFSVSWKAECILV